MQATAALDRPFCHHPRLQIRRSSPSSADQIFYSRNSGSPGQSSTEQSSHMHTSLSISIGSVPSRIVPFLCSKNPQHLGALPGKGR